MNQIKIILVNSRIKNILVQSLIFVGFFCVAFVINKIPHNFFIAGGDFYQVLDPSAHLSRYFYAWINQGGGQGAFNTLSMAFPFYSILALLDYFGLNSATIASFQMFFVLYCSYLSFYFSVKVLFPSVRNDIRMGGSLLYALNHFTLTLFIYPWSFTHHILFYIFIPPLLSLFIKIFSKDEFVLKDIIIFTLFFLLSTVAYNNLAFFGALLLSQAIIFLMLLVWGKLGLDRIVIKKIIAISFIYFIGAVYFIFPFYLANAEYRGAMVNGKIVGDVLSHVNNTPNTILNILQLHIPGFGKQPNIFNLLYPLSLFLLFFVSIRSGKKNPSTIVLLSLFLLFALLTVRLNEPFTLLNSLLYSTTFFALFRSQDKIFMLLPFFYVMLLVGLLHQVKLKQVYVYGILIILLLIPYKFYTGGIINALTSPASKSSTEYYSYIIKIPKEYYQVRESINKENSNQSIISLPYSVVNSLNWSNYPMWHFVGHDPLHLLYNKNYISANTYDHPNLETQLSFKNFNERNGSPEELLRLIQKFSGQFIFFHKDIASSWVTWSLNIKYSLGELVRRRQLDLVASNEYFNLYEVKKKNLVPIIYSQTTEFFKKINPSKYRVILHLKQKENIIFNQSHSSQWKLYLVLHPSDPWCQPSGMTDSNKKEIEKLSARLDASNSPQEKMDLKNEINTLQNHSGTECQSPQQFFEGEELSYFWKKPIFDDTHRLVDQYANGWTIDPEYIKQNFSKEYYTENPDGSIDVEITLYFKPQSYFYLGLIISGLTLIGCLGYLVWDFVKKRKNSQGKVFVDKRG